MATTDVAVSTDLAPQRAWELASDLRRFDEWLTIFGGWRSDVPPAIEVGTCVSAYDEPKLIEMSGAGRGGIKIGLTIEVQPKKEGARFRVVADLSGGVLSTPVGRLVARFVKSEVQQSVTNLAALR
jgi:hypothetical protein